MATIKVMGCGGRYSYLAFMPCRLCMAEPDDECKKVLKNAGYQGKHEEWWTVR